ncbi:phenylalanine--tRNA ligase subunit beta [Alkalispirochaeta sphaeroplastigenens]|uniref:Phenylalanine--tRNA ligase beta subunit n=1 Tax=Alkalispirochaeta sphaeroplastigenens TaxID=1187066 RepID=A0A2S4JRW0_9SPIO|nr:phenylalanine--tRNA ligase subunit beta [Alkalispirochaeta sphaeroplastigenens]POR02256.1 phenylalanine--tRNA ligase subunit beta [Alkalispirochaeta sphaeroplastigenens]
MPKIEVYRDALIELIGSGPLTDEQLENIFPCAKAELDEAADETGIMKVELNDTNRPDLWSTAGLARQLRIYQGGEHPSYPFFSDAATTKESAGRKIVVDPSVREIRPWVVGFVMTGAPVNEAVLKDLIQTQEKLTWNYGRKRKSIAMGLYRSDLITYPVHYRGADPGETRFVPLQMEQELSLREILQDHPKGQEYAHIVEDLPLFPLLEDDTGEILSFPPVINSAHLGAVQEGDSSLFVELTGTDLDSLLHAASIVACDAADLGYTVEPVEVEYPWETPWGRSFTVPYYFQAPQRAGIAQITALLGVDFQDDEILRALGRMGIEAAAADGTVEIRVPPYRNDFLHPVDVVEDVMIGCGMDYFAPQMPRDFTMGRLTPLEEYSRRLKTLLVGLGFQEMVFNYLGSGKDYIEKLYPRDEWDQAYARTVQVDNPMSENYAFVRPSVIASLLQAESVSANAVYPHNVFEVGKVAEQYEPDPTGTRTLTNLGFLTADRGAGFNLVNSRVSAILYYMGHGYSLRECRDSRFIPGRAAEILLQGTDRAVGVFGELHPRVLDAWGIQMPCTAGEINLEGLLNHGGKNGGSV